MKEGGNHAGIDEVGEHGTDYRHYKEGLDCVSVFIAESPGSLPTLYLAASAIRMFAAIATVVIFLFLVDDRASITAFVITFLSFYFVRLSFLSSSLCLLAFSGWFVNH